MYRHTHTDIHTHEDTHTHTDRQTYMSKVLENITSVREKDKLLTHSLALKKEHPLPCVQRWREKLCLIVFLTVQLTVYGRRQTFQQN